MRHRRDSYSPQAAPFAALRTGLNALNALFVVTALSGLSIPVQAQTNQQSKDTSVTQNKSADAKIMEKQVTVDVEDATLASILTTLMQSVGANYTLDNSLRAIRITAHLNNLRLDTTLDILLRASTPAVTYRIQEGVYQFVLKPETPPVAPEEQKADTSQTSGGVKHLQVVRVNFLDAAEAARLLGGLPIRTDGQTYGLIDPAKFDGRVTGNGTTGTSIPKAAGGNGQGTTIPANFLDYLWIVNVGAGF